MRVGCYPGSFDPPTVAHLTVTAAARDAHGLERVDLVVSRRPLAKAVPARPTLEHRVEVLRELAARVGWLGVVVSDLQLVVDLADGYDVVVVGADKWLQLHDPRFYGGSVAARDAALARLPAVAVAPRSGIQLGPDVAVLDVGDEHAAVSSTAARSGARRLMVDEARSFDERTGAWTDPARYDRWCAVRLS